MIATHSGIRRHRKYCRFLLISISLFILLRTVLVVLCPGYLEIDPFNYQRIRLLVEDLKSAWTAYSRYNSLGSVFSINYWSKLYQHQQE